MDYLKIKNWDRWQTYRKDRGQPPWIKIHRRLMRNPEWVSLSDAERGQLVVIWLLAADHDGVIPASPQLIQKLCFMSKPPDLNKFTDLGFIENGWRQRDVNVTSNGSQHVTPKAEAEENKNREKMEKQKFHDYVFLTKDEYQRLCKDFGKKVVDKKIWYADEWLTNHPKERKNKVDHNKMLRKWLDGDGVKPIGKKKELCPTCNQRPIKVNGLCEQCNDERMG